MRSIIITIIILSGLSCNSQNNNKPINNHDKSEYFKIIYEKCPEADILEIENKGDFVEIEYLCGGKYFEIGISNFKVIFIETEADSTIVPYDKIKKKLKKKYDGWLLDETSLILTNDTSFLKVEIIKDGLEQNLFFTTDGKWYKSKSILVSDKWTLTKLSQSPLFKNADYKLLAPDSTYELPDILKEVSGITLSNDAKTIYCVQDELGIVFEYDYLNDEIKKINRFTDVGDFEGITIKGDTVYVLRSDGNIFYFNYKNKNEINQFMISINALNFESITYNKTKKTIIVVSKDAILNTRESKRYVYEFPYDKPNDAAIILDIDIKEINNIISSNLKGMESNDMLFNPSAIAIHPITQDTYLLSASDRILVSYSKKGLKSVYPLPAEIYYKPEGITFFKNGDMLISNEGDKRGLVKGNILFFRYK